MLSHCLPDPLGHVDQARAWRLLQLTGSSYRVFLASLADGPVNLAHWRRIQAHAARLGLELGGFWRRWLAYGLELIGQDSAAKQFRVGRGLDTLITQWRKNIHFNALLCTDVGMRTAASSGLTPVLPNELYLKAGQIPTLRTPVDDLDLNFYRPAVAPLDAPPENNLPPRIVLHADWRRRSSRVCAARLRRLLVPVLRHDFPGIPLRTTRHPTTIDPLINLRQASLVLIADDPQNYTGWSTIQALALRLPVIAPAPLPTSLSPENGRELLLATHDRDWVEMALYLLRSEQARAILSHSGRMFVERHQRLHPASEMPAPHLTGRNNPHLAKAA